MPSLQYDRPASWSPSRAIQTNLRCSRPESSVLTLDWTGCRLCFVVDLVEEHVGLGGSQFSEPILERLCSVHASQTECGNPGIRKSMFTSFSIVCSWLESSWFTTGCPVRSLRVSSPTLNLMLSWQERVWQPSGTFSVFVCFNNRVAPFDHVPFQRWDSCCHQMNVFGFYSFPQRVAPFYPKKQLLREKNLHRSPGNGTLFFHLARFSY